MPAYFFSGMSHEFHFFKFFFKKAKNYLFLFVFASPIFRAQRIIKELLSLAFAGHQNYSDLGQRYLPHDLGLNNSEYPTQPHPMILKYLQG